jgi:hypothetical protein
MFIEIDHEFINLDNVVSFKHDITASGPCGETIDCVKFTFMSGESKTLKCEGCFDKFVAHISAIQEDRCRGKSPSLWKV